MATRNNFAANPLALSFQSMSEYTIKDHENH